MSEHLKIKVRTFLILIFSVTMQFLTLADGYSYHPLITDDTGTQGKGRLQYEFQFEYSHDKEEGIRTQVLNINNTLTYGLTDSLDIALAIPYLYWKEENGEVIDEAGISDIELGIKYRFYEGERFRIALKPSILIPAGDEKRGLGAGRFGGSVFLIFDRDFESFTLFLNAGYIRNENNIGERENLWHLSLAGEYRMTEALKVVANAGIERDPERDSEQEPVFLIAGAVYTLSESLDLSGGIKAGLTETESDLSLMAGITMRF
ncbi:MAG: transporter [Thermodesulfovibrionales bacterium]|nr:transporter [Thermodesulfovibrionales bacterium]